VWSLASDRSIEMTTDGNRIRLLVRKVLLQPPQGIFLRRREHATLVYLPYKHE
jgi:hypothetical protein